MVPYQWSAATTAKLSQAGVPAWLQLQEGAGHVPWAAYQTLYLEQSSYFLYFALDLLYAAGQPQSARQWRPSVRPAGCASTHLALRQTLRRDRQLKKLSGGSSTGRSARAGR